MMKTNIYVDGFNLFYGCLKKSQYKWLDLSTLCKRMFPNANINRIRYFTAAVSETTNDPGKPQRQQTYIRALKTIPNLSVHYGYFLSYPRRMRLADPPKEGPRTVEVIRTEEKGSDVNLATYLLLDGFQEDYDVAIVISNDSDLVEPIKVVKDELELHVTVVNPSLDKSKTSQQLLKNASSYRRLRMGVPTINYYNVICVYM